MCHFVCRVFYVWHLVAAYSSITNLKLRLLIFCDGGNHLIIDLCSSVLVYKYCLILCSNSCLPVCLHLLIFWKVWWESLSYHGDPNPNCNVILTFDSFILEVGKVKHTFNRSLTFHIISNNYGVDDNLTAVVFKSMSIL